MNIIIVHGTKGGPEINWFPWARRTFGAQGFDVYTPAFPTPHNQTPADWLAALDAQAPRLDEHTILVGHSIGATFLLHVLEKLARPVARSIFVAPVMDDLAIAEYTQLNHPFVHHTFNWPRIKAHAGRVSILHGDNDPYVPVAHAEKLAGLIGGDLHLVPGGGHLNGEAGYTALPLLNEYIAA